MNPGSRMSGRFVAPMTKRVLPPLMPSISVRIWLMTRSEVLDPPEHPAPQARVMEFISSKKRTQGDAARALSKRSRTFASEPPNYMLRSSGPLMEMKLRWCPATSPLSSARSVTTPRASLARPRQTSAACAATVPPPTRRGTGSGAADTRRGYQ